MTPRLRAFLALSLCAFAYASNLCAQFSWKPQPLPAARTFLVTEVGYAYRLNHESFTPGHHLTSAVGLMRNINLKYSIGATTFVGVDTDEWNVRGGLKLRLQRWFKTRASADVGAGVLLRDAGLVSGGNPPVFVISVSGRPSNTLGFLAQLETGGTGGGRDNALYLGMTVGSTPGLVINALGALSALVWSSIEIE